MAAKIVSMHAAYRSGREIVDGFLARPFSPRPNHALVLVHGYRGLDDGQRAVTRRFAREGFVCVSPDLFHGAIFTTPEDCALQKTALDIPKAVTALVDSVQYLRRLPFARGKKIALLGFCMGGGLALYALAKSQTFAAGVIYYQSLFPDSEDLKSIRAPLLCHYGTRDANTTKREIELFRESLDRYRKKYQIEMYAGAQHAFLNNPQGNNAANQLAAARSVSKTTSWLKKVLS